MQWPARISVGLSAILQELVLFFEVVDGQGPFTFKMRLVLLEGPSSDTWMQCASIANAKGCIGVLGPLKEFASERVNHGEFSNKYRGSLTITHIGSRSAFSNAATSSAVSGSRTSGKSLVKFYLKALLALR